MDQKIRGQPTSWIQANWRTIFLHLLLNILGNISIRSSIRRLTQNTTARTSGTLCHPEKSTVFGNKTKQAIYFASTARKPTGVSLFNDCYSKKTTPQTKRFERTIVSSAPKKRIRNGKISCRSR